MPDGLSVQGDHRLAQAAGRRLLPRRDRRNAGRSPAHVFEGVDLGKDRKGRRRKIPARVKAARLKERLDRILGIKPNPVQVDECGGPDQAPSRFFHCPNYDECMHVACVGNWLGFTCSHCGLFARFNDEWSRAIERQQLTEGAFDRPGGGETYPDSFSTRARRDRGKKAGRGRPRKAKAAEAQEARGEDRVQRLETEPVRDHQQRESTDLRREELHLAVRRAGAPEQVLLRGHAERVCSGEESGERRRRGRAGPCRVRPGGRGGDRS